MKTLLSIGLALVTLGAAAQKVEIPGGVNSNQVAQIVLGLGVGGAAVSNAVLPLTVANYYTNFTPYYADVKASVSVNGTGFIRAGVSNLSAVLYNNYDSLSTSAAALTNTIAFTVPPSNYFKITGVTLTAANGAMQLTYYATNSSGSGSSGTDAATVQSIITAAGLSGSNSFSGKLFGGIANPSLDWENRNYWFSSVTPAMKIFVSDNLYNGWKPLTTNSADYADPDQGTNSVSPYVGPLSTEFTVQYDQAAKAFYGVYNYDPYNTNANAQALAIAVSYNITNWSRLTIIWPNGKTNGAGATFAATWFTDLNNSNYLVYGWAQGPATSTAKNTYIIRRLDSTYTNWSAPIMIETNTVSTWDEHLIYNPIKSRYELYYYDGAVSVATNSNITSLFTKMKAVTDANAGSEAPYIIKFSETYWRCYSRSLHAQYVETWDAGETWTKTSKDIPAQLGLGWHGPGIFPAKSAQWRLADGGIPPVYLTYAGFDANTKIYSIEDTTPVAITNFSTPTFESSGFVAGSNGWFTNTLPGLYEITFSASVSLSTAELLHVYVSTTDGDGDLEVMSFGGSSTYRWPVTFNHVKRYSVSKAFRVAIMSDLDPMDVTVKFPRLLVKRLMP